MPHRRKTPELVAVDEAATQDNVERYFRLDPGQDPSNEQEILKLDAPQVGTEKLQVREREEVGIRSNEPDIESLLDAERATLQGLEATWGQAAAERRPLPWGWFALIALVLVGVAVWALRNIIFAQEQLNVIRVETDSMLHHEKASVTQAQNLIEAIESSLMAFSTATNIEEMARVIRHPERVRPLMEDYYSRNTFKPLGIASIEMLRPLTLGKHGDFWVAALQFNQDYKKIIIIQSAEDEAALIDWETAVIYQPMAWDDYARQKPEGSTMDFRVNVRPDTLYSHEFRDSEKWDCYVLTTLNSEEILYGYVKSDSPTAQLVQQWFERTPSQQASMILRLSIPEGLTSPRGVVIDEALSMRWIYIVSPDDQS